MSNKLPPHRTLAAGWRWGCLVLLTLAIVGLLIAASRLIMTPSAAPSGPLPTGDLRIATATPTATPTPTPTSPPLPTTAPENSGIGIGSRVRVSGTGTAGLNLRDAPGTSAQRVTIAAEGNLFIVAGGPQESDGFIWWLLKDEANPEREGWGVVNYLVQEP